MEKKMRHELFDLLPKEQLEILERESHEFSIDFLGFTDYYKALASVIEKHYMIGDLGCNYATQCYYFKEHRWYIGVDNGVGLNRIRMKNTTHYFESIQEFISRLKERGIDTDKCFAIVNYVPDREAVKLAKDTFRNIFAFYPTYVTRSDQKAR